jgi:esterase/lipase superfamily enzyme
MKNLSPFTYTIALIAFANACSSSPSPLVNSSSPVGVPSLDSVALELNTYIKDTYSDTAALDVHYTTNRSIIGDKAGCSDTLFSVTKGEKNSYGVCRVNVPKRHQIGSIEMAPSPRADPHKFFRFLTHRSIENLDGIKSSIEAKPHSDILVFVHGFNVKFEEAIARAAQIAYDVKFQGPVLAFTWPAGAGSGLLDSALISRTYNQNQANAKATIDTFVEYLQFLSTLNARVHIMVHSMGHQIVLPAIAKASGIINKKSFIGELILNAPDIGVDDFIESAPRIKELVERITLYCSYNDNAIIASQTFNGGRRMGGCEKVEGVDVVNVGEIDAPALGIGGLGHGYYASRPILGDVSQVLLRIEAEKRLFIRKSEPNSTEDFILRP